MKRADRIVAVVQKLLELGDASVEEVLRALKAHGVYGVDIGEAWETLTQRGVASFDGASFSMRSQAATPISTLAPVKGPAPQSLTRPSEATNPTAAESGASRRPVSRSMHPEAKSLRRSLEIAPLREESRQGKVPQGWPSRARELAQAVRDELREAAGKLNQLDVPVEDGYRVTETDSRVLYRFDVQGELPSGEGATVTFLPAGEVAGEHYEAEIISVFGSEVTLALPVETPEVRAGRLRCDLTWLLLSQEKRLHEVQDGAEGFDAEAAFAVTGGTTDERRRAVGKVPLIEGLNARQSQAVTEARLYGTTWLWGPPGTGKTTTVAALAEKLVVEDECRVLLVAPTNVAVDVAVNAMLRRMPPGPSGTVVRLGPPTDPELVGRPSGRVLVDEVAAERGSDVAARRVAVGQEIGQLREDLARLRERSGPVIEQERRQLERALADRQELAKDLDGLLRELRRQVCRDASLVAATTHQVLLGTLKGLPFDVVIIDEGSMVPTALAALVAGSGQGHTIVAGDFRQLPPVTQSDSSAVLRWLRRSPFESCGVDMSVQKGEHVPGLIALVEQHRMRQGVSDMVSTSFYPESPLETADSVRRRPRLDTPEWPTHSIVLIDTTTLRSRVSRRQGQWSRLNIAHAQLAAAVSDHIAPTRTDLAFISPFSPQAKLLGAYAGPTTRASTVHRYQGSEAEFVVFDAVDTRASVGNLHPWFAAGDLGGDGARLVNVAASRARDQFILLADMSRVLMRSSTDAVAMFLRQVERQGARLDWRDLVVGSRTRLEANPLPAMLAALAEPGPVEMFLPTVDSDVIRDLLRGCEPGRLEQATVWVADRRAGVQRLLDAGAFVRPLEPLRESLLVVGDSVVTASHSLASRQPGNVMRTRDAVLAEAVRRVVRRRGTARSRGSGEYGENCGRCGTRLVRMERFNRSPYDQCLSCSPGGSP